MIVPSLQSERGSVPGTKPSDALKEWSIPLGGIVPVEHAQRVTRDSRAAGFRTIVEERGQPDPEPYEGERRRQA